MAAPAKTLTIAIDAEPNLLFTSMGSISGMVSELKLAYHQHLANYDDRGAVHPMLAAELPSPTNGTWVVRADGSMQTTYRLRTDVRWHDGRPLTVRDFVFAWTVTRDTDIPMSNRATATAISSMATPDDFTLVLEWPHTNPFANVIVDDDLGPLPAHLLVAMYEMDKERFQQLPYWTREFVGVGPFRIAEWEPGSHMVLKAFDGFYRGQPKLDTLMVRFILSDDAIVAGLLAGSVDGALRGMLELKQALVVNNEWLRAGKRAIFITQATEPDSFMLKHDPRAPLVGKPFARYRYDPARAAQELADGGWRRGSDGRLLNQARQQVQLALRSTAAQTREVSLVAQNWRDLGIDVTEEIVPGSLISNDEYRAKFSAFEITAQANSDRIFQKFDSRQHATPENRYKGSNTIYYVNPALDRLIDRLFGTSDEREQGLVLREMGEFLATDLPALPIYYGIQLAAVRTGVRALADDFAGTTQPGLISRNAHLWDRE